MKIAIIGGGVLGSLFAASFAQARRLPAFADDKVILIGASIGQLRPHLATMAGEGLAVITQLAGSAEEKRHFAPGEITVAPAFSAAALAFAPVDAAIVLVKSYQTATIAPFVARLLGLPPTPEADSPGGVALTLQNGLGNAEVLEESCGWEHVALGTTRVGGYLRADTPGTVWLASSGETVAGLPNYKLGQGGAQLVQLRKRPPSVKQALDGIAARLAAAEVPFSLETSPRKIESALWRKLAVNCAFNPLSALLDVPSGRVAEIADAWSLASAAAQEVALVAVNRGLPLSIFSPDKTDALIASVAVTSRDNITSMLQDVRNRRLTEIDAINGAVVAEAERLNLLVPVNNFLTQLVRARQSAYGPGSV